MVWCLGLDQALRNTGWVVGKLDVETKTLTIKISGVWCTKSGAHLYESIQNQLREVKNILSILDVRHIYAERVFIGRKNLWVGIDGYCLLSHINMHCYQMGRALPTLVDSSRQMPRSWRRTIGAKEAGKKVCCTIVEPLLDKKLNEHEADAIAILMTGLYHDGIIERIQAKRTYEFLPGGGLQEVSETLPIQVRDGGEDRTGEGEALLVGDFGARDSRAS